MLHGVCPIVSCPWSLSYSRAAYRVTDGQMKDFWSYALSGHKGFSMGRHVSFFPSLASIYCAWNYPCPTGVIICVNIWWKFVVFIQADLIANIYNMLTYNQQIINAFVIVFSLRIGRRKLFFKFTVWCIIILSTYNQSLYAKYFFYIINLSIVWTKVHNERLNYFL